MSKPMTIQDADYQRLESFRKPLGVNTRIEVLRKALDSLEIQVAREKREKQWEKTVKLVIPESRKVNREFQKHSLIKNL